jgi:hypothetical protein
MGAIAVGVQASLVINYFRIRALQYPLHTPDSGRVCGDLGAWDHQQDLMVDAAEYSTFISYLLMIYKCT